ncbi:MAG: haloacid dehalogenase [Thermoprotei archaeon]|nr:MAG: haloacid dehalogenase [Thermoprotei archaeon]
MGGAEEVINRIINSIAQVLTEKDSAREEIIRLTRDVVRLSRSVVNSVLQGAMDRAAAVLKELESIVEKVKRVAKPHPELMYTGLVYNALAEFVEAELLYHVVAKRSLVSPEELEVHYIPYLQGLCDFIGEIKRYILKLIREKRFNEADELLRIAEHIFMAIQPLSEYPDALVPGLRRKIDIMRKVLEDLEKFLLDLRSRNDLISRLEQVRRHLV